MIKKTKNKICGGSALAYALVIMSVTMIILVSMIGYVTSQLRFSSNRAEKEKALQIAEAGVFWYRWYIAHETAGKTAEQINSFWQNTSPSPYGIGALYEQDFSDPEGGVIGRYSISVDRPASYSTIAIVRSTGWTLKEPNLQRTVQVRFRRPSWSEYSVLANDFMRFGVGTNVYGEIHSNKGIRFDGVAHNVVSSLVPNYDDPDHTGGPELGVHTHVRVPPLTGVSTSALSTEMWDDYPGPTRTDVFMAGREFPVPEVSFSGVSSDLNLMKEIACDHNGSNCTVVNTCANDGCYFDDSGYGRRIVLNANDTMTVRTVNNYDKDTYDAYDRVLYVGSKSITNQSSATTYTIPDNGVIFVDDNVWLEGSVNGKKITIVAANLISGASPRTGNVFLGATDLNYTNVDGSDIIGVVAQNDVEIMKISQDDLTIYAALLAQNGRVGRGRYYCRTLAYNNNGTPGDISDDIQYCAQNCTTSCSYVVRDIITLNGSLATNLRYGFGYTNGSGYTNRELNFDNNLLYYPPPFFPTGTEYSMDLWEEL